MSPRALAFLFDVDGVIAETPHEQAWRAAALEWRIIGPAFDFTPFYARHVAGEPGNTGALNILALLHEDGEPPYFERERVTSPHERERLTRLFRKPVKTKHLESYIQRGEFRVFEDVARIVLEARKRGHPTGVVSSSEYASSILHAVRVGSLAAAVDAGIPDDLRFDELFDVEALGAIRCWHGWPIDKASHYAMAYGKLLQRVGAEPIPRVAVLEDAPKGISAVKRLGFLAIGISRISTSGVCLASAENLKDAGADVVYNEEALGRLTFDGLLRSLGDLARPATSSVSAGSP